MTQIFISYSRKDLAIAEIIIDALAKDDLEPWIDWKSIPKGEPFEIEIQQGIEKAEIFLFLISPDSIQSDWCNKEIAHAVKNGKRILPIVIRDADPKSIHPEISKRNWIFCREGQDDFNKGIEETRKTIQTDYEWLKFHTNLQLKAIEWERNEYENGFLLHSKELDNSEKTFIANLGKEPLSTELQNQFVAKSRIKENLQLIEKNKTRSRLRNSGIVLAVIAVLALWFGSQVGSAQIGEQQAKETAISEANARATAQSNAETEAIQRATAQANAVANAEEAQMQANIALARKLATQAQSLSLDNGTSAIQSGLLAVQAEKLDASLMSDQALRRYLAVVRMPIAYMTHNGKISSVSFSFDGSLVVSGSNDGVVRVWEANTGKEITHMIHNGAIFSAAFSPDGKFVVSGSADATARVWEVATGKEISRSTYSNTVTLVAFSPSGKYIVSGSWDGKACVWEAASGHSIACLLIPTNQLNFNFLEPPNQVTVTSAAFSPDGKYVVSGSWDGTAYVWEVTTGREVSHMTHGTGINSVAFSPDGKYVLSQSFDWDARVWEVTSGKLVVEGNLPSSELPINFDPDPESAFALSGYSGQSIRMWNIITELGKGLSQEGSTTSIAFSPDGKYVVSGSEDGTARIWESDTGKQIARIIHENGADSVAFSPDGKWIVSGGCDTTVNTSGNCLQGTAYVWANISGKGIADINSNQRMKHLIFSPDSKFVAGLAFDNEYSSLLNLETGLKFAGVWNIETGIKVSNFTYSANITSISFSPDSKYILSGSTDNTARIWEVITGNELVQQIYDGSVTSVAFSPDGSNVVSDSVTAIHLWNVARDEQITFVPQNDLSIVPSLNPGNILHNSVAVSVDNKYVASLRGDTAYVWDPLTGKQIAQIRQSSPIDSIAFTPNGKLIVTTVCDKTESILAQVITKCVHAIATVWNPESGKEVAHITHDGGITSIAFSSDGKFIVSGSEDRITRLWDPFTGREISQMIHDGSVDSVAFSPDGKYIVTGGCEVPGTEWECLQGSLHVWEALTGKEIARMAVEDRVIAVRFSLDGKYAISGSAGGIVQTWSWLPNDLISDACKSLPRNLTRAEWNQYIGDVLPYQAVCSNLPIESEITDTPAP